MSLLRNKHGDKLSNNTPSCMVAGGNIACTNPIPNTKSSTLNHQQPAFSGISIAVAIDSTSSQKLN